MSKKEGKMCYKCGASDFTLHTDGAYWWTKCEKCGVLDPLVATKEEWAKMPQFTATTEQSVRDKIAVFEEQLQAWYKGVSFNNVEEIVAILQKQVAVLMEREHG